MSRGERGRGRREEGAPLVRAPGAPSVSLVFWCGAGGARHVGGGGGGCGGVQGEEEEEGEESLFKADAVNEEDPERDRATQV